MYRLDQALSSPLSSIDSVLKMDSDDGGGNNLINLTTEEELDIVEGPSEKVTSELGADVHSFASLHTDMPLASLNEPLLMNLTEDGLESAIQETLAKFTSFSPLMLAARIRSMQNWATILARDQGMSLSFQNTIVIVHFLHLSWHLSRF